MSGSNFVDYVKICCRSGKGGAGSTHLHRDKKNPYGGPDGGDGGRGGHIIIKGNKQLWTLLHLKYRKHVIAEDGQNGGTSLKTGSRGKDEVLEVPLGTIAKDAETGEIAFEITDDEIVIGIIGRLVPVKNHALFINAVSEVIKCTSKNFKKTQNLFTINALLKCTTFPENNVNGMPVQQKNIFFVTQN